LGETQSVSEPNPVGVVIVHASRRYYDRSSGVMFPSVRYQRAPREGPEDAKVAVITLVFLSAFALVVWVALA